MYLCMSYVCTYTITGNILTWVQHVCRYIRNILCVAPECPSGMTYQQCGPRCPQTCDNIGSTNCLGGCAEGCFCPDGQVLSGGRCINPIACPGT